MARITLRPLLGHYAVSRLAPDAALPAWADGPGLVSITRTDDEVSVVCPAERTPADIKQDAGWIAYKFVGPFAFDETGIVSSVIGPLSAAGIGIFVISTFDGDHLLIKDKDRMRAEPVMLATGHILSASG
jgi:hypothetical protein